MVHHCVYVRTGGTIPVLEIINWCPLIKKCQISENLNSFLKFMLGVGREIKECCKYCQIKEEIIRKMISLAYHSATSLKQSKTKTRKETWKTFHASNLLITVIFACLNELWCNDCYHLFMCKNCLRKHKNSRISFYK